MQSGAKTQTQTHTLSYAQYTIHTHTYTPLSKHRQTKIDLVFKCRTFLKMLQTMCLHIEKRLTSEWLYFLAARFVLFSNVYLIWVFS